ncbi:Elongator complex protein [Linderina pennispora]|nr:Elongator complex protein [Linderina pennispora]
MAMADSRPTPSNGLAIRKIAAFQQFAAPLVVLSETAQQTSLALLECLVREGLDRGLGVAAFCLESSLSDDIVHSPHTAIIDNRPSLEQLLAGQESPRQIDFAAIEQRIRASVEQVGRSCSGCLLVIDSLEQLLWASTSMTFVMLRSLRKHMAKTFGSDTNHRILARYPRDTFAGHIEDGREQSGSPILVNSLGYIADAIIDVYPTDVLPSWCPGWFSDGKPKPFLALTHNDPHRCLLRFEQRRQSGKVGVEVASFEAVKGRPVFANLDVSEIVNPALPEPIAAPLPTKTQTATSSTKTAPAKEKQNQQQQQTDPTANLSFNLTLTDKQREDKASVVLPYTDAQMDEGSSGGEIHYQLDDEDDWDSDDPDDDLEI